MNESKVNRTYDKIELRSAERRYKAKIQSLV